MTTKSSAASAPRKQYPRSPSPPPPAQRAVIDHCLRTGGYMADTDPHRVTARTLDSMVRKGWLVQKGNGSYILTEAGRAAYPIS